LGQQAVNSTKRIILHVYDVPQITSIVARQLNAHWYHVMRMHDPQEALEAIMRSEYRVVLLDIDMPGLDGLELLRKIKAFDGGIQAIMLTGVVRMSAVLQSLRIGAEACFFKPLEDYQPLLDAVASTFTKIDRWWTTLEELSLRRREGAATESNATTANRDTVAH